MKQVDVQDLKPEMVIARNVYGKNESLLIGKGTILNRETIEQLKRLGIQSLWIETEEETTSPGNEEIKRITLEIETLLDAQFERVSHNLIMKELKRIFASYLIEKRIA